MGGEPTLPGPAGAGNAPVNGCGGGGGDPASYWFDACEDDSLAGIDFSDFDHSMLPSFDQMVGEDGFLGEIDRILESVNGDQGAPPPAVAAETKADQKEDSVGAPAPAENGFKSSRSEERVGAGEEKKGVNGRPPKRDGGLVNGDWRYGKRARFGERGRFRDPLCRRRPHDWEDGDRRRREGDWSRKRERDGLERRDGRDRDWRERERESRGYWERDKSGKVVFRVGSWEAEPNREAKKAREDGLEEAKRSPEKRQEEKKEKPAEELARQYQLDVLEQAKKKNTIAFLETGAGKTLIAVLLIKSVCSEMLKENKKMLAIFLVPKVPLVYQVVKGCIFFISFETK